MINSVAAVAFHHLAKSIFTCIPTRLLSHRSMLRIYVALSVLIYWVSVTFAWPTLTAVLVNHTQTFDREYIDFNITPTSTGSHDVYINIRKSLPNVVSKVAVNFETKPNEYGYQFINKTFSTCKFYSSKKTEPLLQILYQVAVENPSVLLPRRCPIKSGVYHFLNALISTDKVPPISTRTHGARMEIQYFLVEKNENMKSVLWLTFYFKLQRK